MVQLKSIDGQQVRTWVLDAPWLWKMKKSKKLVTDVTTGVV